MAERRSRRTPSSGVSDNGGQSAQFELSAETRGDPCLLGAASTGTLSVSGTQNE